MDRFLGQLNGTKSAGGMEAVMHLIQPHGIDPIIPSEIIETPAIFSLCFFVQSILPLHQSKLVCTLFVFYMNFVAAISCPQPSR